MKLILLITFFIYASCNYVIMPIQNRAIELYSRKCHNTISPICDSFENKILDMPEYGIFTILSNYKMQLKLVDKQIIYWICDDKTKMLSKDNYCKLYNKLKK